MSDMSQRFVKELQSNNDKCLVITRQGSNTEIQSSHDLKSEVLLCRNGMHVLSVTSSA